MDIIFCSLDIPHKAAYNRLNDLNGDTREWTARADVYWTRQVKKKATFGRFLWLSIRGQWTSDVHGQLPMWSNEGQYLVPFSGQCTLARPVP